MQQRSYFKLVTLQHQCSPSVVYDNFSLSFPLILPEVPVVVQFVVWFQHGYIPHQAQNSPQGSQHRYSCFPPTPALGTQSLHLPLSIWPLPKGETAKERVKGQHHEFTHFTHTSPSPWLRTLPAWRYGSIKCVSRVRPPICPPKFYQRKSQHVMNMDIDSEMNTNTHSSASQNE